MCQLENGVDQNKRAWIAQAVMNRYFLKEGSSHLFTEHCIRANTHVKVFVIFVYKGCSFAKTSYVYAVFFFYFSLVSNL